jgi:hypothetical protein
MLAAGVAVVAAGAVAGTVIVMKTAATPTMPAAAATFTMRGSINMPNTGSGVAENEDNNGGCHGIGGFSDITPGTAVMVQDDRGQTVAMGSIGTSAAAFTTMNHPEVGLPPTLWMSACTMYFAVAGVPDGRPLYSVTVSHRGSQVFTSAQAHGDVELTLTAS